MHSISTDRDAGRNTLAAIAALKSEAFRTPSVNAEGVKEIGEFLGRAHKKGPGYFTDDMLRAWAQDAEFQLGEGNPPTIEIPARDSVSGATVTYTITSGGVDA